MINHKTIEVEVIEYRNKRHTNKEILRVCKPFHTLACQWSGGIKAGVYHIETKHIFANQYNTVEGFRIHEYNRRYSEYNHSLTDIGYYINPEDIKKIREVQKQVKVCNYCEAQYWNSKQKWCNKCLGSEYLAESEMYMLELLPLLDDRSAINKDIKIPKYLINKKRKLYNAKMHLKNKQRQANDLEEAKQGIIEAKTKYNAKKWLIDNNVYTDNVIYYSHLKKFSFGWRGTLDSQYKSRLLDVLSKFPYDYEIKEK